jgi:hypothetical protein
MRHTADINADNEYIQTPPNAIKLFFMILSFILPADPGVRGVSGVMLTHTLV